MEIVKVNHSLTVAESEISENLGEGGWGDTGMTTEKRFGEG